MGKITKREAPAGVVAAGVPRIRVKFKRLHKEAKVPRYQSPGAAGLDLHAVVEEVGNSEAPHQSLVIGPGKRVVVQTGLTMVIPDGFYGRIAPRSGLAVREGVNVLAGVVDSDYRGEVGVVLHNTSTEDSVVIRHADRIAQLIITSIPFVDEIEELGSDSEVEETERGDSGFGSTGSQ